MRISIIGTLILLSTTLFGQKNEIQFSEIVPKYVLAVWKNDGTIDSPEFQNEDLYQLKAFLAELSKRENNIASNEFIKKPTANTLVGNYLNKKLLWNSFNGPHVGIKKLDNVKVVKDALKSIPSTNELLAHYYLSIFGDVLNKQKPMNLSLVNIELDKLDLSNDSEKAILFLCAMRHLGGQVSSYSTTRFPDNCFRAEEYVKNMPRFNGKAFYEFELPEFEDFKIEVDKRYPKMSFKERYLPEFENAKSGYERCLKSSKN